jgi:PKD repeat protein
MAPFRLLRLSRILAAARRALLLLVIVAATSSLTALARGAQAEPVDAAGAASPSDAAGFTVAPRVLYFGCVPVGECERRQLVVMADAFAAEPLTIVEASTNRPAVVVDQSALPVQIEPGGQHLLEVEFCPASAGWLGGLVTVQATPGAEVVQLAMWGIAYEDAPLVCDAGGPYEVGVDEPVQLDGRDSSGGNDQPLQYRWTVDGEVYLNATPIVSLSAVGRYDVVLEVTSCAGASAECSTHIDVVDPASGSHEPPVCSIVAPAEADVGESVLLDGRRSYDPDGLLVEYHWYVPGSYYSGTPTAEHAFASPGVHQVRLRIVDDGGHSVECETGVDVRYRPECEFTAIAAPEGGQRLLFDGRGSYDPQGSTITSYAWEFGDGATASGATAVRTYAANGYYTVTLTVTSGGGYSRICSQWISVEGENAVPSCSIPDAMATVIGEPFTFDAVRPFDPDGSIVSYRWDFGDGTTSSDAAPMHVYRARHLYDLEVCATDDDGASNCWSSVVRATDGPGAWILTSTAIRGEQQCFYWIRGDIEGRIWQREFQFHPNSLPTSFGCHTYEQAGFYGVTLTVYDDLGPTGPHAVIVDVNEPPQSEVSGPYHGRVGEVITFDGRASRDLDGGIVSYTWSFEPFASGLTGPVVEFAYPANGSYTVTLVVSDNQLATATSVGTVHVTGDNLLPSCDIAIPEPTYYRFPMRLDGRGSSDPDGTIETYIWTFEDGSTAEGAEVEHTFDRGEHLVTLCVFDDSGSMVCCEDTADAYIGAPWCRMHDAFGPDTLGSVDFSAGCHESHGVIDVEWQFGDGATGTGSVAGSYRIASHTYSASGFFTVTICVTDGYGTTACSDRAYLIDLTTPVSVSLLGASTTADGVLLTWTTGFEADHAGFYVLRGDSHDPGQAERISELIRQGEQPGSYRYLDTGAHPDQVHYYWLVAVALDGSEERFGPVSASGSQPALPTIVRLHPCHPNPFNPETRIRFDLPRPGPLELAIYDSQGRRMRTLVAGRRDAGTYDQRWDGRDNRHRPLPSGIYYLRLAADGRQQVQKLVLVR